MGLNRKTWSDGVCGLVLFNINNSKGPTLSAIIFRLICLTWQAHNVPNALIPKRKLQIVKNASIYK